MPPSVNPQPHRGLRIAILETQIAILRLQTAMAAPATDTRPAHTGPPPHHAATDNGRHLNPTPHRPPAHAEPPPHHAATDSSRHLNQIAPDLRTGPPSTRLLFIRPRRHASALLVSSHVAFALVHTPS